MLYAYYVLLFIKGTAATSPPTQLSQSVLGQELGQLSFAPLAEHAEHPVQVWLVFL